MAHFIDGPTVINAAGHPPKRIEEFIGGASTNTNAVSIARMVSPSGWTEPGQTPDFDEYTLVLHGALTVETRNGQFTVKAGQALIAKRGNWVRYSTPEAEGAEYIAVCSPAFSPDLVNRDEG